MAWAIRLGPLWALVLALGLAGCGGGGGVPSPADVAPLVSFVPVGATLPAVVTVPVLDAGEQGLLGVVADPSYEANGFVFLYGTQPSGAANEVLRFTVAVDPEAGTFSLDDRQTIVVLPKSDSPSPGTNHNGGGMVFDAAGFLVLGVGDGGGAASADPALSPSRDPATRLGKLLRVVPSRTPAVGGFTLPPGGNGFDGSFLPEIFATGLRNPFTLVADGNRVVVGDVGGNAYEEVNLADRGGLDFGWPLVEGPSATAGLEGPIHWYAHDDATFNAEDPAPNPGGARSVMVGALYAEFYDGWVRGLSLDADGNVLGDQHLGHLAGMTSLQQGPDGLLYALSLFGGRSILRLAVP